MTTLMTQKQADTIRSVGEGAIVLWAMWVIDQNYPGRMTKPKELLPYLHPVYKDTRKLETQLNALCASGRLAQTTAGYVLLEGGKALLLEISSQDLALSPANAGTEITEVQVVVIDGNENQKILDNSAREMRALKKIEGEDESKLINLSLSSSTSSSSLEDAQNAEELTELLKRDFGDGNTYPKVFDLLKNTPVLFGRPGVFIKGLKTSMLHPRQVLGWLAHAYDQWELGGKNGNLTKPSGLVHKNLAALASPSEDYMTNFRNILPPVYLEAIGLMEYPCECNQVFKTKADFEKHEDSLLPCKHDCGMRFHTEKEQFEHHQSHAEFVTQFKALEYDHEAVKIMNLVKETLALDMPRASFDTWVRDIVPVGFQENKLTVAVRNAYARDWLESRLTATVETILNNILHKQIRVLFVVGVVEGEE